MYFVDCACGHERFKEFLALEEATEYYNLLPCKEKILYKKTEKGKFHTVIENSK